ncbi:hypothetical protein BKA66DRAFT_576811 [Pyrenochaeta sp. MPI-SDFR-AT-0127]|nr:hypothetical protein BKA66DRAFT_576811 [Pyrenochaeta sp. MPI-SDFR-AT-0127]
MDEPARKRRRTNSPEEHERQSSPLRKPPRRPSFASPTKASLARNYPNLLRPTSAGEGPRPISRSEVLASGKQARAFVLGEKDVQERFDQEIGEDSNRTTSRPKRYSPTAQNVTPRTRKVVGQRNAPVLVGAADNEEPDLPTTPSQRGLEKPDGPRRGVLFSSPSKRPPRMKGTVKRSPPRPTASQIQTESLNPTTDNGSNEIQDQRTAEETQPPEPEVQKRRQERVRLQREIEELDAQVSRCTEEISKELQRAPGQALRPTERDELNDFINKISDADTKDEKPASISSLLCSFLPFSALSVPPPRPKVVGKSIPSHRPVELKDPLPYLEMFTTFKFSTRLSLPRGKVPRSSTRVHQMHTIDIEGPQKLLTAQTSIILDAFASEVIEMHIVHLSSWAERELGTFLRSRAKEKDMGNACWAIDSYWEIAKKRAQYWQKCETSFLRLVTGHASVDTENISAQIKSAQHISRKDLRRHLGRDTLVLQDEHVLLKIKWRISFDWTGEAESEITVEHAVPQVWQDADTTSSLRKIPETFASLLRSKGAFEATRIMVALLFAQ